MRQLQTSTMSTILHILSWIAVGGCTLIGLAGTLIPLMPGNILILFAAFLYNWTLAAPGHTIGWATMVGLSCLTALAYVIDFVASIWGAKKFGSSSLGIWGGVLGLLIGFFLGLPGLLFGPPLGVIAGELYTGKTLEEATRSAFGTIAGTDAGMLARFGIALIMTLWLALAIVRA